MTRTLSCSYLYTTGTLVRVYKEIRKGVQVGETADITLGWCALHVQTKTGWSGYADGPITARIVLRHDERDGFLSLAKGGRIDAVMPDSENGSQNTKSKGVAVQYVKLTTAKGLTLEWTEMPALICPQFTIQNDSNLIEVSGNYAVGGLWGSARILKVTDLRPKAEKAVLAA